MYPLRYNYTGIYPGTWYRYRTLRACGVSGSDGGSGYGGSERARQRMPIAASGLAVTCTLLAIARDVELGAVNGPDADTVDMVCSATNGDMSLWRHAYERGVYLRCSLQWLDAKDAGSCANDRSPAHATQLIQQRSIANDAKWPQFSRHLLNVRAPHWSWYGSRNTAHTTAFHSQRRQMASVF